MKKMRLHCEDEQVDRCPVSGGLVLASHLCRRQLGSAPRDLSCPGRWDMCRTRDDERLGQTSSLGTAATMRTSGGGRWNQCSTTQLSTRSYQPRPRLPSSLSLLEAHLRRGTGQLAKGWISSSCPGPPGGLSSARLCLLGTCGQSNSHGKHHGPHGGLHSGDKPAEPGGEGEVAAAREGRGSGATRLRSENKTASSIPYWQLRGPLPLLETGGRWRCGWSVFRRPPPADRPSKDLPD